ncbi:hypothetical protein J2776_002195 [Paraburkholderia caledonica]|uniref:Uncharacterized protein n=1 Tax=Paraburkholderia caledonica TaxID=134536 RepID=A0ABU1KX02_9BURK|nr:hypothetical protein [Paraburkholderia caledonica]
MRGGGIRQHADPIECKVDTGFASSSLHFCAPCDHGFRTAEALATEILVRQAIEWRVRKELMGPPSHLHLCVGAQSAKDGYGLLQIAFSNQTPWADEIEKGVDCQIALRIDLPTHFVFNMPFRLDD